MSTRFNATKLACLLALMVTLSCSLVLADTFHVNTIDDFHKALSFVEDGDDILIAPGTYALVLPTPIYEIITLRGDTGDPADVILDLAGVENHFIFLGKNSNGGRIENLTLQNYSAPVICIQGYRVGISNCILTNNQGGARTWSGFISSRDLTMSHCLIEGNEFNASCFVSGIVSEVLLEDCQFRNNVYNDSQFGTIAMNQGQLTMNRCDFSEESTSGLGTVSLIASTAEINDCHIMGSNSLLGPQIRVDESSQLTMTQSRITGNSGGVVGSVISVLGGSGATFSHCELVGNEGLLWVGGYIAEDSSTLFQCCEMDLTEWELLGDVEFDNEGCSVSTTSQSFDGLKALFR